MSDKLVGGIESSLMHAPPPVAAVAVAAPRRLSPDAGGWAQTAMAIRGVRQLDAHVVLALRVADVGVAIIDSERHSYIGEITPEAFPVSPSSVRVETWTDPRAGSEDAAGHDLDGLLWRIGYHGFDDGPAYWRAPDERYRLLRWPNIASLDVDADELRVIALLTNGVFAPHELASSLGVDIATVQRVINALSLIGILESSVRKARTAVDAEPVPGLFRRLRKRLGF